MMDGVHDLGGMEGFDAIPIEENEKVFLHDWEPRVISMLLLMGAWRRWNLDAARHSVERLPPADYLSMSYYERWLAALVNLAVENGLITREEVAGGRPDPEWKRTTPPIDAQGFLAFVAKGRPSARVVKTRPAFSIGDRVRTARHGHSGHTRLPRYVRGCIGEIVLHHGAHVLPDVSSTLGGEAPEHLYTVRFMARELWGSEADSNYTVCTDLWESYLAPAN